MSNQNNQNQNDDLYIAKLREFDIDDPEKAYEDWSKNQKTPEDLMKMFPPEQPDNVMRWGKEDFRDYFKTIKKQFGKEAAWDFLYAKILERSGEGDGGVEIRNDGDLRFV